jgi:prepilin-type N-terminal cleavage/methylation domain-containing protein
VLGAKFVADGGAGSFVHDQALRGALPKACHGNSPRESRIENPQSRIGPRAGFTLYEVIIVLIVLLVVSGIVVPSFSGLLPSVRVRRAGDELLSTIAKARDDSVLTSRRFRIVFTREPASYRLEYEPDPMNEPATFRAPPGDWGAPVELPPGVTFSSLDGAVTDPENSDDVLEFLPDGTAAAMTIVLAHENGDQVVIGVDPADGRARVVEEEEKP